MLLSRVARRSAPLTRRMASRSLTHTPAVTKALDLEVMFKNKHWKDSKDTVHEISDLLNECTMNRAARAPDAALEEQVCTQLKNVEQKLQGNATHDAVQAEVFGLKRMVKSKLYGQA